MIESKQSSTYIEIIQCEIFIKINLKPTILKSKTVLIYL